VTSNEGQDNTGSPDDRDHHIDPAFDYDYMLDVYNANNTEDGVRNEWDLVFHRVLDGLGGRIGARQLIEWVLETVLGLNYSQNIENVERFGKFHENPDIIRPIRVRMSTVEEAREILRRAKNLTLQIHLGRIYIQPFLSLTQLEAIRQELDYKLYELKQKGYTNATIAYWRIVRYVYGEPEVLYTPQM